MRFPKRGSTDDRSPLIPDGGREDEPPDTADEPTTDDASEGTDEGTPGDGGAGLDADSDDEPTGFESSTSDDVEEESDGDEPADAQPDEGDDSEPAEEPTDQADDHEPTPDDEATESADLEGADEPLTTEQAAGAATTAGAAGEAAAAPTESDARPHAREDEPTTTREEESDSPWEPLRAVLAVPAGLLEGVVTVVAAWLFVGMIFLFEIGGDIENFAEAVGAPTGTSLGQALEAFSTEELLVGVAKLISWMFAGAHQVAVDVDAANVTGSANIVTELSDTGGWVTPILYWIVPPILLLYGGYQLSRAKTEASVLRSVGTGAMIAIGYALAAVVIAWVSSIDASGATVGVDPLLFGAIAALYAVVFGGIGGLVAAALHRA